MLLLDSITDLLETRQRSSLSTTLHKIRAHTNIRGNDLADAAAKLAVTHYDTLPPTQTRRVEIGEIAPRPHYWVMYTAKPPPPAPTLSTGTNRATLRRPWWTIPAKIDCKCMRSRVLPLHFESKFGMRYYVAYTIPLFIGGSL